LGGDGVRPCVLRIAAYDPAALRTSLIHRLSPRCLTSVSRVRITNYAALGEGNQGGILPQDPDKEETMIASRFGLAGVLVVLVASLVCAGETESKAEKAKKDLSKKLAEIEAKIKKKPGDPMLHYRKAQCLMKLERRNEGYDTAKKAMKLFIKKKNRLAWMLLESVELETVRVDVHFNMGPGERKYPEIGIVRPLSFRIWAKGKDANLLEIIDFELGVFNGKANTAALGQTVRRAHTNFGMLKADAKYEDIRKQALALIGRRHPASKEKKKEGGGK
jgi:hypothetical protein